MGKNGAVGMIDCGMVPDTVLLIEYVTRVWEMEVCPGLTLVCLPLDCCTMPCFH